MASITTTAAGNYRVRARTPEGSHLSRTFRKKSEAKRFADQVEADKSRGIFIDPRLARTYFSEVAADYLSTLAHVSEGTLTNIKGRLDKHILPVFGGRFVGTIQPQDVRAWVSDLVSTHLAPSTIRGIYSPLSAIMTVAVLDGLIPVSPCRGVKLPPERKSEMLFLDENQIALLATTVELRYRALILTAAYTGMRWGELAGLQHPYINLLHRRIEVGQALTERSGTIRLGSTKTGKTRTLRIPNSLAEALAEHIRDFPAADFVFSSANALPLRHSNWYDRQFKPAVKRAELDPRFRFHDLRHSNAALRIATGANAKQVMEALGHSTIRITFDRYGHLFEGHDDKVIAGLDDAYQRAAAHSN